MIMGAPIDIYMGNLAHSKKLIYRITLLYIMYDLDIQLVHSLHLFPFSALYSLPIVQYLELCVVHFPLLLCFHPILYYTCLFYSSHFMFKLKHILKVVQLVTFQSMMQQIGTSAKVVTTLLALFNYILFSYYG